MAKKTLNDLLGTRVLVVKSNGEECSKHDMYPTDKLKEIEFEGDIFYMLDENNNFEIKPVIVKFVSSGRGYNRIYYSEDIEGTKSYIPTWYLEDRKRLNSREVLNKIQYFEYKGARSHCGRFFANEEDAKEWQKKVREGKVFKTLKKGDTVYFVSSLTTEKPISYIFDRITQHIGSTANAYELYFKNMGAIIVGETIWEDKLSDNIDSCYYTYPLKRDVHDRSTSIRFFVNEKDAYKAIFETDKRRKKSATDKYIKSIENHDGKPIAHKDNLGNDLHYGDTVAYIRRVGYNGHAQLSRGVVVGESKTTITVLDSANGKHSVTSQSVLLIELAEVNKNSGFIFTKS